MNTIIKKTAGIAAEKIASDAVKKINKARKEARDHAPVEFRLHIIELVCALLGGIVIGMLISPKGTMECGNNYLGDKALHTRECEKLDLNTEKPVKKCRKSGLIKKAKKNAEN